MFCVDYGLYYPFRQDESNSTMLLQENKMVTDPRSRDHQSRKSILKLAYCQIACWSRLQWQGFFPTTAISARKTAIHTLPMPLSQEYMRTGLTSVFAHMLAIYSYGHRTRAREGRPL